MTPHLPRTPIGEGAPVSAEPGPHGRMAIRHARRRAGLSLFHHAAQARRNTKGA
jgi:hypothetical protein